MQTATCAIVPRQTLEYIPCQPLELTGVQTRAHCQHRRCEAARAVVIYWSGSSSSSSSGGGCGWCSRSAALRPAGTSEPWQCRCKQPCCWTADRPVARPGCCISTAWPPDSGATRDTPATATERPAHTRACNAAGGCRHAAPAWPLTAAERQHAAGQHAAASSPGRQLAAATEADAWARCNRPARGSTCSVSSAAESCIVCKRSTAAAASTRSCSSKPTDRSLVQAQPARQQL